MEMAVVQQQQNAPSLAPMAGLASAIAIGVYIGYSIPISPFNVSSSWLTTCMTNIPNF